MSDPRYILLAEALEWGRDRDDDFTDSLLSRLKRGHITGFAERYMIKSANTGERVIADRFNYAIPVDFWIRGSSTGTNNHVAWAQSFVMYSDDHTKEVHFAIDIYLIRTELEKEFPYSEFIDEDEEILINYENSNENVSPENRQGPRPEKRERVKAEMRLIPRAELAKMKQVSMENNFRASRETCRRAREEVLSEIVEGKSPTNSDH